MQAFKGDKLELQISGATKDVFDALKNHLTNWFNGAYDGAGLGAVIYDNNLLPLSRTIARDIFIKNYGEILRRWEYVGSFETYLFVFMQIFGPSTEITFEKLGPAALKINITTNQHDLFKWITSLQTEKKKYITNHNGKKLLFRALEGIGSFYEVQSVLDSLNPAGIYLLVNFTLITGA